FSVYGYWEAAPRLIPTTMLSLLRTREMRLTVAGIRRDFIFVEDVVEACVKAATVDGIDGEIFNIASGEQSSNADVVAFAEQASDARLRISSEAFPARPADTDYWVADIHKARQLLDWEPRHSLRAGLEKRFEW